MKFSRIILFWIATLVILAVVEMTTGAVSWFPSLMDYFLILLLAGLVFGFVMAKLKLDKRPK